MKHITVLTTQAVDALNLQPNSVAVDCTLGSGGHAREILSRLSPQGQFIGLDVDPTAIAALSGLSSSYDVPLTLHAANFSEISSVLTACSLQSVDAILADLGWRTEQFDGSSGVERGFSFQTDEPLVMTFGNPTDYSFTAAEIVNEWEEEVIANILFGYAQERFARRIASRIVTQRVLSPITTTSQLVDVIKAAVPSWYRNGKTHPATRSFQALRIAVNDEFSVLERFLPNALEALAPGGRMAIISFHSLEDRIVKQTFRSFVEAGKAVLVHKKPISASDEELADNPRARSAKLRTIEKIS